MCSSDLSRETDTPSTVLTSVRAGNLEIRVTSRLGDLHMGDNQFAIEFRDTTSGTPVDVGTVRASGAMSMPGMAMTAPLTLTRERPGVYAATGQFTMSGTWTLRLDWDGPVGRGSTTFEGHVR